MAFPKEPNKITEPFGFVGGQMLQNILNKMPDAITEEERDILRGRISYLTPEQIKNYGLEEKKEEETSTPPTKTGEREAELNAMKDKDLKKLAKKLKIDVREMSKADMVGLILDAEKSEK